MYRRRPKPFPLALVRQPGWDWPKPERRWNGDTEGADSKQGARGASIPMKMDSPAWWYRYIKNSATMMVVLEFDSPTGHMNNKGQVQERSPALLVLLRRFVHVRAVRRIEITWWERWWWFFFIRVFIERQGFGDYNSRWRVQSRQLMHRVHMWCPVCDGTIRSNLKALVFVGTFVAHLSGCWGSTSPQGHLRCCSGTVAAAARKVSDLVPPTHAQSLYMVSSLWWNHQIQFTSFVGCFVGTFVAHLLEEEDQLIIVP